ncbi:MAG: hypothetical protein JWQ42_2324 [Edaphobacter sp.]|nr:hypothetical protein [Edaphobacter sp.]
MNKRERGVQLYNLLRTARLNVLYYEESLHRWTIAIRTHDVIVAVTSAASPIAYFKHSSEPIQKQMWFYFTLAAGIAGLLKPIFRLDKQIALYTELVTHYRELHHDLKCLAEDMAANRDFSLQLDKRFQACRLRENDLQKKEPVPQRGKIERLQAMVEREYDLSEIWLPQEE